MYNFVIGILFVITVNFKIVTCKSFNEYITDFKVKNCSFPDPFFYDKRAVPEDTVPVLSLCQFVLPDVADPLLPLAPNLLMAKDLCSHLLSFSEAMCAPSYKGTADTYLKTEAIVSGVKYNDTMNVCWFADKFPRSYAQYMPAFMRNRTECNKECSAPSTERPNNVQAVCQLLVSTLCQFQTTWKGCVPPEYNGKPSIAQQTTENKAADNPASDVHAGSDVVAAKPVAGSTVVSEEKTADKPASGVHVGSDVVTANTTIEKAANNPASEVHAGSDAVTAKPVADSLDLSTDRERQIEAILAKNSNVSNPVNPTVISNPVKISNGSTAKPLGLTGAPMVNKAETAVKPTDKTLVVNPLPTSGDAAATAKPTEKVVDEVNTSKVNLADNNSGKMISPGSAQSSNQTLPRLPSVPSSTNTELKKTILPLATDVNPTMKPAIPQVTQSKPNPAEPTKPSPQKTAPSLPKENMSGLNTNTVAEASPRSKTGEKVITTGPPSAREPNVPINIDEGRGRNDETPMRGIVSLPPVKVTPKPAVISKTSGSWPIKSTDLDTDGLEDPYESYNNDRQTGNIDRSFDVYQGNGNTGYRSGGYGNNVQTQNHRVHALPGGQESPGSGHFFAYFLTAVVICISGYVIFHNKQKIVAFIVEGRTAGGNGSRRRGGGGGVKYSQLKSSVEEVMPSLESAATNKNFVY